MPHLFQTLRGAEARAMLRRKPPAGPGVEADVEAVEIVKVMASSFNDPGPDWTRFDAYDCDGAEVGSWTLPGY